MDGVIGAILAIAGGTVGAAIVSLIGNRIQFRAERKAKKEDREEEKKQKNNDGRIENLENWKDAAQAQFSLFSDALMVLLLDRIRSVGQSYIKAGCVDFDDKRILRMMHDAYKAIGGNGDADAIMHAVDKLPLERSSHHEAVD